MGDGAALTGDPTDGIGNESATECGVLEYDGGPSFGILESLMLPPNDL